MGFVANDRDTNGHTHVAANVVTQMDTHTHTSFVAKVVTQMDQQAEKDKKSARVQTS